MTVDKKSFYEMTSKDLLAKACSDFDELAAQVCFRTVFNFFVTAYHLKDYLTNEFALAEKDLRSDAKFDELLTLAGFVANKGKHLIVNDTKYKGMQDKYSAGIVGEKMHVDPAFQIGRGEEFFIVDANRKLHDVVVVAEKLIAEYKRIIITKSLCVINHSNLPD